MNNTIRSLRFAVIIAKVSLVIIDLVRIFKWHEHKHHNNWFRTCSGTATGKHNKRSEQNSNRNSHCCGQLSFFRLYRRTAFWKTISESIREHYRIWVVGLVFPGTLFRCIWQTKELVQCFHVSFHRADGNAGTSNQISYPVSKSKLEGRTACSTGCYSLSQYIYI